MTAPEIQTKANLPGLLSAMRYAFNDATSFVFELLQNARRAGATQITLRTAPGKNGTVFLVVEDNGAGLDCPSVLLNLATSGWDQEIKDSDDPFGVGFLSCVYAGSRVRVQSRFGGITFDTASVIAGEAQAVDPCLPPCDGVRVIVECSQSPNLERLTRDLDGFPVAVSINGENVERPRALESLRSDADLMEVELDIGRLFLPKELREVCPHALMNTVLFVQGFPIKNGHRRYTLGKLGGAALHLTSEAAKPAFPDRMRLHDHDVRWTELSRRVHQEVADYYTRLLQSEPDNVKLWNEAFCMVPAEVRSLYNDWPYIPGGAIYGREIELFESTTYGERNCDYPDRYSAPIPKADVESGAVKLYDASEYECNDAASMNLGTYAVLHRATSINGYLFHVDHWIKRQNWVLCDSALVRPMIRSEGFAGCKDYRVVIDGDIWLDGPWGSVNVNEHCLWMDGWPMVLTRSSDAREICNQQSLEYEENEREEWIGPITDTFLSWMASLNADIDTFQAMLDNAAANDPETLVGDWEVRLVDGRLTAQLRA